MAVDAAEQPDGHDDDVSIAGGLKRRRHVGQRMRIPNGHEHIARTRVDLVERQLGSGQEIERRVLVDPPLRRSWSGRRR